MIADCPPEVATNACPHRTNRLKHTQAIRLLHPPDLARNGGVLGSVDLGRAPCSTELMPLCLGEFFDDCVPLTTARLAASNRASRHARSSRPRLPPPPGRGRRVPRGREAGARDRRCRGWSPGRLERLQRRSSRRDPRHEGRARSWQLVDPWRQSSTYRLWTDSHYGRRQAECPSRCRLLSPSLGREYVRAGTSSASRKSRSQSGRDSTGPTSVRSNADSGT